MKVNGSATLAAPVAQVWDALCDPAVLVRTIPGCESLRTVGPDTYAMTVSAGVASIKGIYVGEVALADPDPPHSFVLHARGQGAPGTVDATVMVRLSERSLTEQPVAVDEPVAAGVVPEGTVYTAPPAAVKSESVAWAMTAAFGAGGLLALAGIAIGYAIGRRR